MKNIAIIGSGSWGVALGMHLAENGKNVKIWSFSEEEAELINKEKKCKFLSNITIPENIACYTDMEETIKNSEIILHVTPSKFVRDTIKQYKQYVGNKPVVMCAKGFEKDTLYTLGQVIEEELPNSKYAVLSGPSHAEEVSCKIPTAIVIASKDKKILEEIQDTFMNENLRVYTSNDVLGVELRRCIKKYNCFLCRDSKRNKLRR